MASLPQRPPESPEPLGVHTHAIANLRFIRDTMERAHPFTGVPGWGGVLMGLTALAAMPLAARQATQRDWLFIWGFEAAVAFVIGLVSLCLKNRRARSHWLSGPARRFGLGVAPPLLVGLMLTIVLVRAREWDVLPGLWLCLYGAAVVSGGMTSVAAVPAMGGCFLAAGALALFVPAWWGNTVLGLAFGLLHIGFGFVIARRHGG